MTIVKCSEIKKNRGYIDCQKKKVQNIPHELIIHIEDIRLCFIEIYIFSRLEIIIDVT